MKIFLDSISVLSEIFASGTNLVDKEKNKISSNMNNNFNDQLSSPFTMANLNSNSNSNSEFLNHYKRIWYENGVKLAIQYLGEEDEDYMLLNEESMQQKCVDILLNKYKIQKGRS
jgi:hypothetical protein